MTSADCVSNDPEVGTRPAFPTSSRRQHQLLRQDDAATDRDLERHVERLGSDREPERVLHGLELRVGGDGRGEDTAPADFARDARPKTPPAVRPAGVAECNTDLVRRIADRCIEGPSEHLAQVTRECAAFHPEAEEAQLIGHAQADRADASVVLPAFDVRVVPEPGAQGVGEDERPNPGRVRSLHSARTATADTEAHPASRRTGCVPSTVRLRSSSVSRSPGPACHRSPDWRT